jgi:hypothetical protein
MDVGNLQLRCRAHNQYEAVRYFSFDRRAQDEANPRPG